MNIDHPTSAQIPGLRTLWKEAFGDSDAFLDGFFRNAYAPERCLCMTENEEIMAVMYWFDVSFEGAPMAYIYAVATAMAHRGKGYCTALMDAVTFHLKKNGYVAALLVPGSKELAKLYEKMGYRFFGGARNFSSLPQAPAATLRRISGVEYGALRTQYLPEGGIRQEKENLSFLESYVNLYAGEDFVIAVYPEKDTAIGLELLGNCQAAPHILAALGAKQGTFRTPGKEPFAMWLPFRDMPAPSYFGLAFD